MVDRSGSKKHTSKATPSRPSGSGKPSSNPAASSSSQNAPEDYAAKQRKENSDVRSFMLSYFKWQKTEYSNSHFSQPSCFQASERSRDQQKREQHAVKEMVKKNEEDKNKIQARIGKVQGKLKQREKKKKEAAERRKTKSSAPSSSAA